MSDDHFQRDPTAPMDEKQKTVSERREEWETFSDDNPVKISKSEQNKGQIENDAPAVVESVDRLPGQTPDEKEQDNDQFYDTSTGEIPPSGSSSSGFDNLPGDPKSDVSFEQNEKALVIRWDALNKIDHYIVNCKRAETDKIFTKTSQAAKLELKTSTYQWKTGESISVSVAAFDKNNHPIQVCAGVQYVVGGDKVPSNVRLKFNGEDSYKSLVLQWSKPPKAPISYEVTVHHKEERTEYQSGNFTTTDISAPVTGLQPLTKYFCKVRAKYSGGDFGKQVSSNVLETYELPSQLYKVQQVNAYKNPSNRIRQIIVKWEKPKKEMDISRYDVHLFYTVDNKKVKTNVHTETSNMQTRFVDLKSDTTYTACVVTVGTNGKKVVDAHSSPLKTDPVQRTEGFDITTAGKPIIKKRNVEQIGDELFAMLEWDLADLGSENNNYKRVTDSASLKENGKGKNLIDVEEGQRQVQRLKLKWGKVYSFTVQCRYLNFDTDELRNTSVTEKICTDIGKPSIGDVRWFDNDIIVAWSPAKGAEQHILKVLDEENQLVFQPKVLKHPTYSFQMTRSCAYGKTCNFYIEASAEGCRVKQDLQSILIGGDKAVTKVIAKKGPNPRRSITVQWEPPKLVPRGYSLFLVRKTPAKKTLKEDIFPPEASQLSHTFLDLKTNSKYYVRICPIYNDLPAEGSESNTVTTDERIKAAQESNIEFGQAKKITHAVKHDALDKTNIELSWSSVHMGENYKVLGYRVWVYQKSMVGRLLKSSGKWINTTIVEREVGSGPEDTKVNLELTKGQKFNATVFTLYLDLDTETNAEISNDSEIFTDPSKTKINDCGWRNGFIFFSWQSVNGATKYRLIIKDEFFDQDLAPDEVNDVTELKKGCSAKIPMSDKLRIGRKCMTKVIVYSEGERTSQTDWKAHLIGGDKVPRNVKASRYAPNAKRAIHVTFDSPTKVSDEAIEYKIVAIPETGMRKVVYSKSTSVVFEYLRKGVFHEFEVHAKWRGDWSEGSLSNAFKTDGDGAEPVMGIHDTKGKTTVDLTNAILADNRVCVNNNLGRDFGQVQDLRAKTTRGRNKDMISLQWNSPAFGNHSFDFKVEKYKVEVCKNHDAGRKTQVIDMVKDQHLYVSKPFDLELGETYEVSVSTIYLDIDNDHIFKSSDVQRLIHTRPCAPKCTRNDYKNEILTIEWNAATGASRYELELHTDNTSQPKIKKEMGKDTLYKRKFDEEFGYGATYFAVITAFGADNKSNSSRTDEKIIGGDRVPTNVVVTSNHPMVTNKNTQVFLSWTAPQRGAKRYAISSFPAEGTMVVELRGEECLVSGLKAGTEYYFQVKADHGDNENKKLSGGCCSKRIKTNPTPTQVKKVWTDPGANPSTSIKISWEKVSAEKEKETTKYRVLVTKEDETAKRELYVETESVLVQDLDSGSSYFVTVAGGNSIGYGKDSVKLGFETAFGTPKNVYLSNNGEKPSTSLVLEFSAAEGEVLKYISTLHKFQDNIEQPVLKSQEVNSGYTYNDLESNSEYLAEVHAIFAEREGESTMSNKVMTAPSKTRILERRCALQGEEMSSRGIYAKWSTEMGCDYHELRVICGPTGNCESQLFVRNETEIEYLCLHEATQYSVQVRSRNASGYFGDWSDEAGIHLAPARLKGIYAILDKDGFILIQCQVARTHSPFYFLRALCENQPVSEPIQEQAQEGFVRWRFEPPKTAQKYTFELWAEDADKVKGKITTSNPVISRPLKWKLKTVKTHSSSPSTDIEIEWEKQNRCDSYELNICRHDQELPENMLRTTETSCRYRCQSPGDTYLIAVRAIRENVKGEWSDDEKVLLVPSEIDLIVNPDAGNGPVTSVEVKWKPLKIAPAGYVVKLFCDGQEVVKVYKKNQEPAEGDDGNQEAEGHMPMQHIFRDNLKPGSLCYCTVAAYNDKKRKIIGRESKSQNYRIKWLKADNFLVTADENEPSRRAKLTWEQPMGVDCFKLEIENKQTGFVTTMHLRAERYVFDSGIPGNVYTGRLYCGRDERYDTEYVEATITMKPAPPTDVKVVANEQVNGLTIEFKDPPSIRKEYEITADALTNPEDKIVKTITQHSVTLRDLVPGESYKVSVVTIIGDSRSNTATSEGYISTFPEEVKNIRSKIENGSVLFEWDKLDIKPDKYIVQWRVDNEPITDEHTQASTFMIFFLKPAHCYSVRVMAENSSGIGPMSLWENFITDPSPPYNVNVYPDPESPETSLIVKFQDEKDSLKRYRITAKGRDEEPKIVVTHEHFGILTGLKSGREYMVTVQTLFCGKESTGAPYSRI